MTGFHFTLQQVLDYREQLKEQAQVDLARVHAELTREHNRATELNILLEENTARQSDPMLPAGERWLLDHFIKGLREDIAATLMRVRMLTKSTEEAKQNLAIRAKDHKVLDKLKAKQAERHAHEERLKEQRTYDETAAIRFKASTF